MKRDMDVVRKILLSLEETSSMSAPYDFKVEGYSEEEITYNLILLKEARLIDAFQSNTFQGVLITPNRLTWEGHEFLDNARDETRWNEAKKIAGQKGGSMAFDVIKGVLVQLALQTVGLR
jgi:hypothetical protein